MSTERDQALGPEDFRPDGLPHPSGGPYELTFRSVQVVTEGLHVSPHVMLDLASPSGTGECSLRLPVDVLGDPSLVEWRRTLPPHWPPMAGEVWSTGDGTRWLICQASGWPTARAVNWKNADLSLGLYELLSGGAGPVRRELAAP